MKNERCGGDAYQEATTQIDYNLELITSGQEASSPLSLHIREFTKIIVNV